MIVVVEKIVVWKKSSREDALEAVAVEGSYPEDAFVIDVEEDYDPEDASASVASQSVWENVAGSVVAVHERMSGEKCGVISGNERSPHNQRVAF